MSQEHPSKLSFSIEESVWLNKGQEVDEILSLSLEPEISIEESGNYVLIRGGLKLTGEYRSTGAETAIGENASLTDQVAFRSIQEVIVNEDGTGQIRHHFPIDVTIPQERIRSLDDIYVIVESFDYDLPERGCIQLTADVTITGMTTGAVTREEPVAAVNDVEEDRSFYYEAYNKEHQASKLQSDYEQPAYEQEIDVTLDQEESDEDRDNVVMFEDQTDQTEQTEVARAQEQYLEAVRAQQQQVEAANTSEHQPEAPKAEEQPKAPTVAFGVVKNRTEAQAQEEAEQKPEKSLGVLKSLAYQSNKSQALKEAKARTAQAEATGTKGEVEVKEITLQDDGQASQKTQKEENALYLTKMLTKGEEEQFKKLKICIIQENETLDTIAARYDVNESTLIRVNRLDDAKVEEGQILYIPVTK